MVLTNKFSFSSRLAIRIFVIVLCSLLFLVIINSVFNSFFYKEEEPLRWIFVGTEKKIGSTEFGFKFNHYKMIKIQSYNRYQDFIFQKDRTAARLIQGHYRFREPVVLNLPNINSQYLPSNVEIVFNINSGDLDKQKISDIVRFEEVNTNSGKSIFQFSPFDSVVNQKCVMGGNHSDWIKSFKHSFNTNHTKHVLPALEILYKFRGSTSIQRIKLTVTQNGDTCIDNENARDVTLWSNILAFRIGQFQGEAVEESRGVTDYLKALIKGAGSNQLDLVACHDDIHQWWFDNPRTRSIRSGNKKSDSFCKEGLVYKYFYSKFPSVKGNRFSKAAGWWHLQPLGQNVNKSYYTSKLVFKGFKVNPTIKQIKAMDVQKNLMLNPKVAFACVTSAEACPFLPQLTNLKNKRLIDFHSHSISYKSDDEFNKGVFQYSLQMLLWMIFILIVVIPLPSKLINESAVTSAIKKLAITTITLAIVLFFAAGSAIQLIINIDPRMLNNAEFLLWNWKYFHWQIGGLKINLNYLLWVPIIWTIFQFVFYSNVLKKVRFFDQFGSFRSVLGGAATTISNLKLLYNSFFNAIIFQKRATLGYIFAFVTILISITVVSQLFDFFQIGVLVFFSASFSLYIRFNTGLKSLPVKNKKPRFFSIFPLSKDDKQDITASSLGWMLPNISPLIKISKERQFSNVMFFLVMVGAVFGFSLISGNMGQLVLLVFVLTTSLGLGQAFEFIRDFKNQTLKKQLVIQLKYLLPGIFLLLITFFFNEHLVGLTILYSAFILIAYLLFQLKYGRSLFGLVLEVAFPIVLLIATHIFIFQLTGFVEQSKASISSLLFLVVFSLMAFIGIVLVWIKRPSLFYMPIILTLSSIFLYYLLASISNFDTLFAHFWWFTILILFLLFSSFLNTASLLFDQIKKTDDPVTIEGPLDTGLKNACIGLLALSVILLGLFNSDNVLNPLKYEKISAQTGRLEERLDLRDKPYMDSLSEQMFRAITFKESTKPHYYNQMDSDYVLSTAKGIGNSFLFLKVGLILQTIAVFLIFLRIGYIYFTKQRKHLDKKKTTFFLFDLDGYYGSFAILALFFPLLQNLWIYLYSENEIVLTGVVFSFVGRGVSALLVHLMLFSLGIQSYLKYESSFQKQ